RRLALRSRFRLVSDPSLALQARVGRCRVAEKPPAEGPRPPREVVRYRRYFSAALIDVTVTMVRKLGRVVDFFVSTVPVTSACFPLSFSAASARSLSLPVSSSQVTPAAVIVLPVVWPPGATTPVWTLPTIFALT